VNLNFFLILSAFIFCTGVYGVLARRNAVLVLMSIELMLNAVNINLVAFGAYLEWGSRLAVENSQTDARPPEHMPMPHWDWHTAAGPPGSRVSALAPPAPEEQVAIALPGEDEPASFERHIKPLFRPMDKQSMSFAFDLWSYDDVSLHADAILDQLRAGAMPCDGRWPDVKVDVFQRWVEAGKAR